MSTHAYVGLDVHKETIAVAISTASGDQGIEFIGTIPNSEQALTSLVNKLKERGHQTFFYQSDTLAINVHVVRENKHRCF